MDASSPLAAFQQSPLLRNSQFPWAAQRDFRFPRFSAASSATMSLREQLQRASGSNGDFMSLKEVRGSSPAASLAADMSQNLGLDNGNSPRFPTPRRTLFASATSNARAANYITATQPSLLSSPHCLPNISNDTTSSPSLPTNTPCRTLAPPAASLDAMMMASPSFDLEDDDDADISANIELDMDSEEDFDDEDSMMLDSPLQCMQRQPSYTGSIDVRQDCRSIPRRGSLSRAKGYSLHRDTQPFRFGALSSASSFTASNSSTSSLVSGEGGRLSRMSSYSSLAVDETSFDSSFNISDVEEGVPSFIAGSSTRPQTSSSNASANAPVASMPSVPPMFRSRMSLQSLNGDMRSAARNSGSPISHIRRPSNPFSRSRKQFRRTLSMFGSADEVMRPRAEPGPAIIPPSPATAMPTASSVVSTVTDLMPLSTVTPVSPICGTALTAALESVMDAVDDASVPSDPLLPHFLLDDPTDSIPRITKETLMEVLDGKFSSNYDSKMVIDCRFEYEYEGGHIDGAVNYNNKELLTKQLFDTPIAGRSLLIFHCEYSAHRAPMMARHVRARDRDVNRENYPRLTYPEVYILEGGYSKFFENHPNRCYPQNYIEMLDKAHERTCERELDRLKTRKAPSFSRAKTFAYGASGNGVLGSRMSSAMCPVSPPPRSMAGASMCRSPVVFATPRRLASF
ncbi:M-phase inducer phosphatase [Ceratocystis lukuohia]|uniref:M-phase inducer phosphatase n=1 Tax=Ceratocystis lukuohia TaxID=2019550 RepID=A0ABR4MB31_9PEZI